MRRIFSNNLIAITVILLLGLIIITWFRGDFLISRGEDSDIPLHPETAIYANTYLWRDISTGTVVPRGSTFYPLILFFLFFSKLGFSIVATEKVFFYLIFVSTGLSMYYLTSNVLFKNRHLIGLIAALFYMFNPYTMHLLWGLSPVIPQLVSYAIFPLLLGLYIQGIESERFSYAILLCIASLPLIYTDPVFTAILWVMLGSYYIFYSFVNRRDIPKIIYGLKFSILTFSIWVGLNAYWIISMSYFSSEELKAAFTGAIAPIDPVETLKFVTSNAYIRNVLRLYGHPFFTPAGFEVGWYPYGDMYLKPPFIFISFLVPILVFSSLLLKSKYKPLLLFLGTLSIISLFLAKGNQPPLGEFFLWSQNISFLQIFRMPLKFLIITSLTYSIMIAITLQKLYETLINKKYIYRFSVLLVLIITLVVVNVFPMWSGEVISEGSEILPSARIKIPMYYNEAYNWLASQEGFRTLALPFNINAFDWEYGGLKPPKQTLSDLPIISRPETNAGYEIINYLNYFLIERNNTQNISKLLALLNVKYILLFNDYHQKYNTWLKSLEYYQSYLGSQNEIRLEKSFGKLDFYKISDKYFLPHIYIVTVPVLVKGSLDDMLEVVHSDNFTIGNNALFLSDQISRSQWKFLETYSEAKSSYAPTITFEKMNPTRYEVKVENATSPFFLVFSESYHPEWKAYVESRLFKFNKIIVEYDNIGVKETKYEMLFTPTDILYLFEKPIDNEWHFLVNGYANAWYIDPKEIGKENFTITLYFRPQSYFYMGLTISGLTLLGCAGYVVYAWRKRRCRTREPNSLTGI
jgi:hypothetical protein